MRLIRRIAACLKALAGELPAITRSIELILAEVARLALALYGLWSLISRLI